MPKTYLQHADQLLLQALSIPGLSGEEGEIMTFLVDQLRAAGATDEVLGFDQAREKSRKAARAAISSSNFPARGPDRDDC